MEHAEFLRKDGGAALDLAVAVSTDWRKAPLAPADFAMLEFSERLTVSPADMARDDVDGLRRHGFDDRAILSVTLAAAYRNYITRVADALGVELRKDGGYSPEILHAFGVKAGDLQTTLYGDRLVASPEPETAPRSGARAARSTTCAEDGPCWIDTTPPGPDLFAHACDELVSLTAPHPLRNLGLAFGKRPEALAGAVDFARLLGMGGSGLGRRTEAIIGVVVAGIQGVPYLGVHHAQALLDHGVSAKEIAALVEDSAGDGVTGRDREIVRFCAKATRAPSAMCRADVESLRTAGFDDRAVLTIGASAAFESFLCGVAAGLGVRREDDPFAPEALAAFAPIAGARVPIKGEIR